MALSPLSRSSFRSSSPVSAPSAGRLSTQQGGPRNLEGTRQGALQKRLMGDGFDAPMSSQQAAGMEATVRLLTQVAQLLAQSVQKLGSELGTGSAPVSGAAAPQAAAPQAAAPQAAPQAAKAAPAEAPTAAKGGPKGERTMTFTNDGTSPMTIQFTPNAGDAAVPPRTLKPGETQTVDFPAGWSGNFRSTAGDGKAATLGEVKFNGGGNQTYYDVSYIEGANAAMTIQPDSGGRKSGTLDNLLASAPDAIKAKDGSGQAYGIKKTTTSNVQDGSVVDYYRQHVGADQGYVIPTDDASTLGSGDSHLSVHLKNLT